MNLEILQPDPRIRNPNPNPRTPNPKPEPPNLKTLYSFSKPSSNVVFDHFCGPQEDAEDESSAGQAPPGGGASLVEGGVAALRYIEMSEEDSGGVER